MRTAAQALKCAIVRICADPPESPCYTGLGAGVAGARKSPARGPGVEGRMLTVREKVETVPGFGVTYRIRRRTWLLFGVLPVAWTRETERG